MAQPTDRTWTTLYTIHQGAQTFLIQKSNDGCTRTVNEGPR